MASDGSIPYVNSFFQQPWWLDAVAPGQWRDIVVKRGGDVAARLPYVIKKRYGLVLLTMPKLTQTLGPWLRPSVAKYAYQLSQQKELMTELIEQLPPTICSCRTSITRSTIGSLFTGTGLDRRRATPT